MPGILSLLFGKRRKRRRVKRKSAHARVYGDFSRTRPKGLTKAIVSKARKCKLKVTRKMGNRRVYKKLSVIKAQIRRKEASARRRRKRTGGDMRRRRCTGFGKRRRRTPLRRRGRVTSATCRKRRVRYGLPRYSFFGEHPELAEIMAPYPEAVLAGPPYLS